jgi:hypothetical protein
MKRTSLVYRMQKLHISRPDYAHRGAGNGPAADGG